MSSMVKRSSLSLSTSIFWSSKTPGSTTITISLSLTKVIVGQVFSSPDSAVSADV